MNKFKLICFVFGFIIVFCIIGSFFVQANSEILEEVDILEEQNNITSTISCYGYSINNPNIIINPFGFNSKSALIMFETDEYVSVNVSVNDEYSYDTDKTNNHFIGVYNLVVGSNKVNLKYGNISKTFEIDVVDDVGEGFDKSILMSNNHFLVASDKYIDDNVYAGVKEVDIFGKIYYEYLLEEGYSGIGCEIDDEKIAVLSNELVVLDRQNGNIISSFDISNYDYEWYAMNYSFGKINLYSKGFNISVDENGSIDDYIGEYEEKILLGDVNYKDVSGIRFSYDYVSRMSDKKIWLLNYKKDKEEKIRITKEFNRIVVSSEHISGCNMYLILDKLFDKRVYKLCNKDNYIYTSDLEGRYSVYYQLNGKVYTIDKYLKF